MLSMHAAALGQPYPTSLIVPRRQPRRPFHSPCCQAQLCTTKAGPLLHQQQRTHFVSPPPLLLNLGAPAEILRPSAGCMRLLARPPVSPDLPAAALNKLLQVHSLCPAGSHGGRGRPHTAGRVWAARGAGKLVDPPCTDCRSAVAHLPRPSVKHCRLQGCGRSPQLHSLHTATCSHAAHWRSATGADTCAGCLLGLASKFLCCD